MVPQRYPRHQFSRSPHRQYSPVPRHRPAAYRSSHRAATLFQVHPQPQQHDPTHQAQNDEEQNNLGNMLENYYSSID